MTALYVIKENHAFRCVLILQYVFNMLSFSICFFVSRFSYYSSSNYVADHIFCVPNFVVLFDVII